MRTFLLASVFACAALLGAAAQAQAPVVDATRFAPLEVGDRWQHASYERRASGAGVYTEWINTSVPRDTLIGSERYVVVVTERSPDYNSPTPARTTCAYSRALGTAPAGSTLLPGYDCSRAVVLPPPLPWTSGPTTVTPDATVSIRSGRTFAVDSLLTFGSYQQGSGQAYTATGYTYATGIGFVSSRRWGQTHTTEQGQGVFDENTVLEYAVVGGVEYTPAVATSPAPATDAGLDVVVFPNPSTDRFRMTATGTTGHLSVAVYDALGRRVASETVASGAAFTFAAPTAGVYVVRATDEAGHTAVRRVVRQ